MHLPKFVKKKKKKCALFQRSNITFNLHFQFTFYTNENNFEYQQIDVQKLETNKNSGQTQ